MAQQADIEIGRDFMAWLSASGPYSPLAHSSTSSYLHAFFLAPWPWVIVGIMIALLVWYRRRLNAGFSRRIRMGQSVKPPSTTRTRVLLLLPLLASLGAFWLSSLVFMDEMVVGGRGALFAGTVVEVAPADGHDRPRMALVKLRHPRTRQVMYYEYSPCRKVCQVGAVVTFSFDPASGRLLPRFVQESWKQTSEFFFAGIFFLLLWIGAMFMVSGNSQNKTTTQRQNTL